ncbi:GNAT family N-acetyltransferase [Marisediminicola senii]|uniref:GNAT family N-acetyltransferase n=1 Tax=Marisediminicola senii TaxID=2711233 RepID=UPI0013EC88F1|nr:GNAT family protein [Marisediminicola senii]
MTDPAVPDPAVPAGVTTPVLRTPRLVLDLVGLQDADAIVQYCQDRELQRAIPVPVPYRHADAVDFVTGFARTAATSAHGHPGTVALWAIRQHGAFAGVIELRFEELASATLGFWLGRPWRGAGIMSEALAAVCDHGFGELGLRRIHWAAVAGNTASAAVAARAGFQFEGVMRQSMVHRDERVDSWEASLLAHDPRTPARGWPL